MLFELYITTGNREVDQLKLDKLEKTTTSERLKAYYNLSSALKAWGMLHSELEEYIKERKADTADNNND